MLLQSSVVIVTAILTQFYLSTFQVPVPPHLISWMTASLMRLQPLYHRSHVKRILNESLDNLKVRGRLVVFFETVGDKKIKKRKRNKKKKASTIECTETNHGEETVAGDPLELTGRYTATQVVLPRDLIQREVAQPATEAAFFNHVLFDSNRVPHDKPRTLRDIGGDEVGLGRCEFVDTPIWEKRQLLFGRLGNFGVLADSAAPEVTEKIEADGQRAGTFRSRLFIQDSKIRLDIREVRDLRASPPMGKKPNQIFLILYFGLVRKIVEPPVFFKPTNSL